MGRSLLCVVCSALVAITIGCGSDDNGGGGTAGTGGSGGTGGTGGAAGMGGAAGGGGVGGVETIAVDFGIGDTDSLPLEGVEICEADTENCATTDEEGDATIEFPANMEVLYTVSKEGYVPELYADVTDLSFSRSRGHTLFTDQEIADAAPGIGTVWPHAGTGWLTLGVNLVGVTFELVGEVHEPWYVDADGTGSTEIDATTTESVGGARGGFVEVAPGTYEVEYGGTATDCVVGIGLPGMSANRIRIPVRAGHISYGSQGCDEI